MVCSNGARVTASCIRPEVWPYGDDHLAQRPPCMVGTARQGQGMGAHEWHGCTAEQAERLDGCYSASVASVARLLHGGAWTGLPGGSTLAWWAWGPGYCRAVLLLAGGLMVGRGGSRLSKARRPGAVVVLPVMV